MVQGKTAVSAHAMFLAVREGVFEFDRVLVLDKTNQSVFQIQPPSKIRVYVSSLHSSNLQ